MSKKFLILCFVCEKINLDLQMQKELESKDKIIEEKENDLYVLRYISVSEI